MVILTGKNWEIDVEPSKLTFSDNLSRQTCSSLKNPVQTLHEDDPTRDCKVKGNNLSCISLKSFATQWHRLTWRLQQPSVAVLTFSISFFCTCSLSTSLRMSTHRGECSSHSLFGTLPKLPHWLQYSANNMKQPIISEERTLNIHMSTWDMRKTSKHVRTW